MLIFKALLFFGIFLITSCNNNLTKEQKKALWDKAQTEGEIIKRSGTPFANSTNRRLALSDAQNRLRTGGGLMGKESLLSFGNKKEDSQQQIASVGMPINPYLWRASIQTIDFMPLSSTDPFAGTIITDWYTSETKLGERCKLNIFINGKDLKTDNLKVLSFCQVYKDNQWVNITPDKKNNIKLENAILNKAKKLKINSG